MAWGRRTRRGITPEKTIIGPQQLHIARNKIESLCQRSVKVMAPFDHDLQAVLPWCFSDDTLKTLRHTWDLIPHNLYGMGASTSGSYKLGDVTALIIDFASVSMLAPKGEMFDLSVFQGQPLLDAVKNILAIKAKFDTAEHVLTWLDSHATAGAIRYYWPAVLSLAPEATALKAEAPSRFLQPDGIAPLLPAIREAAGTIASALLLSDKVELPDRGFSLNMVSGFGSYGDLTFGNITRKFNL